MPGLTFNRRVRALITSLHTLLLVVSVTLPSGCFAKGKVLEYNTIIRLENNNLIEERSYFLQVDDKQSDWVSDIRIPYNKFSRIEILEALVLNSRGETVRRLSKKEIVTKSDISENVFYEDDMVKEFSLRNNEYPYFIKYSYRKTTAKFIYIALWSPVIWSETGTGKATLKVELPADMKVTMDYTGDLKFTRDSAENKSFLTWECTNILPVKKEIFSPPEGELIPRVTIVSENFNYGISGKLDSWKSFGIWLDELNRDLTILPLSEQIKVTSLLNGISGKMEIMKKLYHYMQDNTHYVNVSVDIGNLQPFPASYVCENKYGDCKALTIYMKALLKFAGIESFYTLVRGAPNPQTIKTGFPSLQFNHVILCVPYGNDTIWLENTTGLIPFGYLGTFTQNRPGLLVNGKESRLVSIPAMDLRDFLVKSYYRVEPDLTGKAEVHMEKELWGDEFETWLEISSVSPEEDQKNAVSDELTLKNEVVKYEFSHPSRDQKFIKLTADLKAENITRNIGNSIVINTIPVKLITLPKPETRKNPLRIYFPMNMEDSIELDMPYMDQYDVELPAGAKTETKYGSCDMSFSKSTGKVTIMRHFIINACSLPAEEYKGFYDFIESVRRSMKSSVIILNKKI